MNLIDRDKEWHDQVSSLGAKPDSVANRFRVQRFARVREIIENILRTNGTCRILDIGGTPEYWRTYGHDLDWPNMNVTIVNLKVQEEPQGGFTLVPGDARHLPQFKDNSFDFVHSNSVIEHVGRFTDMEAMAHEVRRLAPAYFVQTPYFWFPIEPHFRVPFFHWMPVPWRCRMVMAKGCGYVLQQPDVGAAMRAVESAVLIDHQQMQYLFPDAKITSERVFGLTKSLMAIRT